MEKSRRLDPDKTATIIRAALAAKMITQSELCERLGLDRNHLNAFLRRRINLIDSDVEKIMEELELSNYLPKLSASKSICPTP
jgi:transcriptional regulator with XRE-family HTH domain